MKYQLNVREQTCSYILRSMCNDEMADTTITEQKNSRDNRTHNPQNNHQPMRDNHPTGGHKSGDPPHAWIDVRVRPTRRGQGAFREPAAAEHLSWQCRFPGEPY